MKTRKEVHEYWINPEDKNQPDQYALKTGWRLVVNAAKKYIHSAWSILEIGSNMGLNLYKLHEAGYRHLSGIEINPNAVRLMRRKFPNLPVSIYVGSVEQKIKHVPAHDLIFSKAVLCHIHPDSNFIFKEISSRARKFIFTFEDESFSGERHCPRNYRKIFEPMGFKQIEEMRNMKLLSAYYIGRIFRRNI